MYFMWLKVLNQSWSSVARLSSPPNQVSLPPGSIILFSIPHTYHCLLSIGTVLTERWVIFFIPSLYAFKDLELIPHSHDNLLASSNLACCCILWWNSQSYYVIIMFYVCLFVFKLGMSSLVVHFYLWTPYFLPHHFEAGHNGMKLSEAHKWCQR